MSSASSTGYAHGDYAAALAEFGKPMCLSSSGGWLLERPVGETGHTDLMGCYPIFSCADWAHLAEDLNALSAASPYGDTAGDRAVPVCASMVVDPFGDYVSAQLEAWFPDLCRPFKQHFVVDLEQDPAEFVAHTHRRNVRKALKNVAVDVVKDPSGEVETWHRLYGDLIARHDITGISAFSKESFAGQLATPGLTMFRARRGEETVGMVLWYTQGDRAYYHLAAYSETGYELRTSFAIFWTAIEYFSANLRWLSLGASAGLDGDAQDGLSRFKKGWSTGTRTAYLCGRILMPDLYEELSRQSGGAAGYFPAYRGGEFS